jgi:hypothetical protein
LGKLYKYIREIPSLDLYSVWWRNVKEKDHFEELGLDMRIIFKLML